PTGFGWSSFFPAPSVFVVGCVLLVSAGAVSGLCATEGPPTPNQPAASPATPTATRITATAAPPASHATPAPGRGRAGIVAYRLQSHVELLRIFRKDDDEPAT